MNEIIEEFRAKQPDGTFQDWVGFYFEEHDGEERLEEATEKAVPMVKKMKEAFEEVDEEMTRNYLRDLILFKNVRRVRRTGDDSAEARRSIRSRNWTGGH